MPQTFLLPSLPASGIQFPAYQGPKAETWYTQLCNLDSAEKIAEFWEINIRRSAERLRKIKLQRDPIEMGSLVDQGFKRKNTDMESYKIFNRKRTKYFIQALLDQFTTTHVNSAGGSW